MKAIIKAEPKPGVEVRDVPLPRVMPGWTLVKVKACGICGSDVHIYEWTPGYEMMAPYLPVVLGHEFSGEVVDVGKSTTDLKKGDRVFAGPSKTYITRPMEYPKFVGYGYGPIASGGMAEYALAQSDRLWELPDNLSYEAGSMIEPLHVAMQAVLNSEILPGENAVVLGPGPIGLLTVLSLKAAGAFVYVTGKAADEERLRLAKKIGADVIINVDEAGSASKIPRGVDVVFEATGVPATIQQGLDIVKSQGKVVAMGIHPSPASIDMLDLVRSAKQLIGSYGGSLSVWIRELALLSQGWIRLDLLVFHRLPLSEAKKGFELCIRKEGMKILFIP